jgi:hypothetical protein
MTHFVQAIVGYDNRCPLPDDVAAQIQETLNSGPYTCHGVTVTTLVQATMSNPTGGLNQAMIQLEVPTGTQNADIIASVTDAIEGLDMPTVPSIVVQSVTVFTS